MAAQRQIQGHFGSSGAALAATTCMDVETDSQIANRGPGPYLADTTSSASYVSARSMQSEVDAQLDIREWVSLYGVF